MSRSPTQTSLHLRPPTGAVDRKRPVDVLVPLVTSSSSWPGSCATGRVFHLSALVLGLGNHLPEGRRRLGPFHRLSCIRGGCKLHKFQDGPTINIHQDAHDDDDDDYDESARDVAPLHSSAALSTPKDLEERVATEVRPHETIGNLNCLNCSAPAGSLDRCRQCWGPRRRENKQ